jgi:hypothetical protein
MPSSKFSGLTVSEQPARMTVMHPIDLEPLVNKETKEECWIELLPTQGAAGALIDRQITDKALRRRVQRLTAKDVETNAIDKLAQLTSAWSLAELDGTPIKSPCTTENAAEMYAVVRWLRDQVATFTADLGNFQPTASPILSTSPSTTLSSTS